MEHGVNTHRRVIDDMREQITAMLNEYKGLAHTDIHNVCGNAQNHARYNFNEYHVAGATALKQQFRGPSFSKQGVSTFIPQGMPKYLCGAAALESSTSLLTPATSNTTKAA